MTFRIRKEGITLFDIIKLKPCEDGLQDFLLWLVHRGVELGLTTPIPKDILKAAFKSNDSSWESWAKEEGLIDVTHEKVNVGHVYRGKKLYCKAKGKLDYFLVFEEPDCDWLYLIDLETGISESVDASEVYSNDDEYYSITLIEEEKSIRLIKDLGPLKNHLKVSAFK